jgi:hypothetical protein
MTSTDVSIVAGLLVVILSAITLTCWIRMRRLRLRYKPVMDAASEAQRLQTDAVEKAAKVKATAVSELDRMRSEAQRLQSDAIEKAAKVKATAVSELDRMRKAIEEQRVRRDALAAEHAQLTTAHERLQREVSQLEENLEDISFGIYKPHFGYDTPEEYKAALVEVVAKQREMVRGGLATRVAVEWSVSGSRREGERMQRQYSKLLLRAFNGECEAAIAKVAWNNAGNMEERIRKAFDAINKLGGVMQVSIVEPYMDLKLSELRLEHELEEKKKAVLEEQRRIREAGREQERAQRQLDAEREDAEEQEARFARALDKARLDAARAKGEEHARLTARILELEAELQGAHIRKERVSALAELTRAGYLYVLSNVGSFGEDIVKIGMTRRADPADRVKELGDASVPFGLDVHAMVYCEDAPALECMFHERFAQRRINLMNNRKEFFKVSVDELQAFATERGLAIAFTRTPEAREYRETVVQRSQAGGVSLATNHRS